ncbi:adenosine 3'-phospho 5'-phosphosulfate transporter 1 isoform X1 [Brevipalpus obovatus]|uniref:adenosine 3'-phospho 5'-phosphosulfate transporter 1 isoform X1 n=1 Tax=Brevipalpus obovatus TaxID=246614 RepID=UPI003D9DE19D
MTSNIGDNDFGWFIKLLYNLYGYSAILLPVAFVVFMVKHNYCPKKVSTFPLVQLLVYGKGNTNQHPNDIETAKLIVQDHHHHNLLLKEEARETKSLITEDKGRKLCLLLLCFAGLHTSYLSWGIYQEKIMTLEYKIDTDQGITKSKFSDSEFLIFFSRMFTLFTSSVIFLFSFLKGTNAHHSDAESLPSSSKLSPKGLIIAPLYKFSFSSLTNILSSWCQYEALKYVNFPTQVLSKACKIPSVMMMSRLVSGKKYSTYEYLCGFSISLGMLLFLLGNHSANSSTHSHDSSLSSNQSLYKLMNGLIVLVLYLAFDSFTSNWEEKIYHKYKISPWQMMAGVNFFSITLTLTSLIEQGNLIPALKLMLSSSELTHDCTILAISSTIGQFFVFFTISKFGALIFTMIMTLRQIFAILLSFAIYGHSITILSILGILVTFLSIIILRLINMKRR